MLPADRYSKGSNKPRNYLHLVKRDNKNRSKIEENSPREAPELEPLPTKGHRVNGRTRRDSLTLKKPILKEPGSIIARAVDAAREMGRVGKGEQKKQGNPRESQIGGEKMLR